MLKSEIKELHRAATLAHEISDAFEDAADTLAETRNDLRRTLKALEKKGIKMGVLGKEVVANLMDDMEEEDHWHLHSSNYCDTAMELEDKMYDLNGDE